MYLPSIMILPSEYIVDTLSGEAGCESCLIFVDNSLTWQVWLTPPPMTHFSQVMDHRQTNHMWGPWYQMAGSYAEPLAGDENPETYGSYCGVCAGTYFE